MSESYLGLPPDNKEAYEFASAFRLAPNIRGKLMLVAGTNEGLFSGLLEMSRALIDAGVQHEIVALPGQYHGYVGKSLEYVLEKQTRFFEEHLTPYRLSRE